MKYPSYSYLSAAILTAFTAVLIPVVLVYFPNSSEFLVSGWSLLWPFPFITIILAMALMALLFINSISSILFVIYAGITISFLFTTTIIGIGGGIVIDGAQHEMSISSPIKYVELIVLTAICCLIYIIRRKIIFNHTSIVLGLSLWAGMSALIPLIQHFPITAPGKEPANLGSLSLLSKDFNILHVMFDSLQADVFKQIVVDSPELSVKLDGFTIYDNHLGYSNWTTLSLPAILANRSYFSADYSNERAMSVINKWLKEESIMSFAHKQGFSVDFIGPSKETCGAVDFNCTVVADIIDKIGNRDLSDTGLSRTRLMLADMALMRLAPLALEPFIYNRGSLLLASINRTANGTSEDEITPIQKDLIYSKLFANYLAAHLETGAQKPTYKFLHFYPPHKPFIFDSECHIDHKQLGSTPSESWEHYVPQATCAVKLFIQIVERLKELGVYDNTVIVLQADTGLGVVHDDALTQTEVVSSVVKLTAPRIVAYARPTLAIKGVNQHGRPKFTEEATQHQDTFRLIQEASRGNDESTRFTLPNVLVDKSDAAPSRYFVLSPAVRANTMQVAPFDVFRVDGPLEQFANWHHEGTFSEFAHKLTAQPPVLAVHLKTASKESVSIGEYIELIASVEGGSKDIEYLFYLRLAPTGKFKQIQEWSSKNLAVWAAEASPFYPCSAELLVSARNRLTPDQYVTDSQTMKLKADGCQ